MNKTASTLLLAVVSLAAGFGYYLYSQQGTVAVAKKTTAVPTAKKSLSMIGQKRADFSLPDLQDTQHAIKEWDNKVILLNFWATWCPPCRKEIPAFIELQEQYGKHGFQVIGVAIDEKEAVEDYADGMGVNYPILIGNNTALEVSAAYGNRFGQLPYSLVIDRQGTIQYVGKGELTFTDIEEQIKPLL